MAHSWNDNRIKSNIGTNPRQPAYMRTMTSLSDHRQVKKKKIIKKRY